MNLVAAYPYLLRHHIRSGCLCASNDKNIPEKDRLLLTDPSVVLVETRHEGDKNCGGSTQSSPSLFSKPRQCWADRRDLPWNLLERSSLEKVARAQNRPLWVCDRMGQEIVSIPYGPNFTSRERLALLGQVEKLTNAIGQCERIHQTAVPLNYARHSLRSLTLWLFTLPFALVKDMGFLTAPVTACTAWLLFGVYQIGYSIEDPFQGSLRLSNLCDAIRRDVLAVADEAEDSRDSAYSIKGMWEEVDSDPGLNNHFWNSTPMMGNEHETWNVLDIVDLPTSALLRNATA
jgi:Bestrophin, RFP-TM, chloride channel